ncbi:50S ribosomal protein L24e [Candidatus Micrarchaeota archaeon]|nr:50S ribosomal protein L24e [Candidatus Micrarchaeota archaeon]
MKCSFCGLEINKGTGKIYSLKDGDRFYFCSGKCEKNQLKLKRKPRKLKWVVKHKKEAKK